MSVPGVRSTRPIVGGDSVVGGDSSTYNESIYAPIVKAAGVNNVYDRWGGTGAAAAAAADAAAADGAAGAALGGGSAIYCLPGDEAAAASPTQFIIPGEDMGAVVVMQQGDGAYVQVGSDVVC